MNPQPPAPTDRPAWGAVFAAVAFAFAAAAPWSIAAAETAMATGAALVAVAVALRRMPYPRLPWTLVAVLAFLAAQLISIPFAVSPRSALGNLPGSWSLLFPFFFWGLPLDRRQRRQALQVLVVSGAVAGLYGVVEYATGRDWLLRRAMESTGGNGFLAVGTFSNHLTYAGVLLPVFFAAIGLALEAPRRLRWIVPALALGLGIVCSFGRTAWIGTAAGLLVLSWLKGRRWFLLALGALAALLVVASFSDPALARRLGSVVSIGDDPRSRLWRTALRILADHPWVGAGLGGFGNLFDAYKVPGEYMATGNPHNDLLNVLVEAGILGGLSWALIWGAFFAECRAGAAASWWSLAAARAGVAGLLVAGFGQGYFTDEEVAEVWWFVAVLALREAVPGAGRRPLGRQLSDAFKSATLPWAARLLGGKGRDNHAGASPPASGQELRGPSPDRILVIRQDNRLGNLLLMTPFLRALREGRPGVTLALLCGEAYAPLLRAWPWLDQRIVQEKRRQASHPWLYPGWVAGVRRGRWDLAFEMSNWDTHSYSSCLLALASGAPRRIGFDHPRSRAALTVAVPSPEPDLHFSLAPLRLLRALNWPAPSGPISCPLRTAPSSRLSRWRSDSGLGSSYAVLHLGGRGDKAWPVDAWAALLPPALDAFSGTLVICAGPAEKAALDRLGREGRGRILFAPFLSVTDLADLIRGAAGFVGCDTGVMHLAVAVGTPTVALFFRSNPYHYAPLGEAHRTVLLANPHGVDPERWARPLDGMSRSPLVRAESEPPASAAGIPETGARAAAAVLQSLRAATAGAPTTPPSPGCTSG